MVVKLKDSGLRQMFASGSKAVILSGKQMGAVCRRRRAKLSVNSTTVYTAGSISYILCKNFPRLGHICPEKIANALIPLLNSQQLLLHTSQVHLQLLPLLSHINPISYCFCLSFQRIRSREILRSN